MKALDFFLIVCTIAFIVAVYFADSVVQRVLFNAGAVLCGVIFGVRLGSRLRKSIEDKE